MMKQLEADYCYHYQQQQQAAETDEMSADYALLQTAMRAGEQQRRRRVSDDRRRSSVSHLHDNHLASSPAPAAAAAAAAVAQCRRTHSLKCPSSPARRRQAARRADSMNSKCTRKLSAGATPPAIRLAAEREDIVTSSPHRRSSVQVICSIPAGVPGVAGLNAGRSGSWRKLRRPRNVQQFRDTYANDLTQPASPAAAAAAAGSAGARGQSVHRPSLDETISSTAVQLRLLQDDDLCVVRCFDTSATGRLINRGDSFKRKHEPLLTASGAAPAVSHSPSPSRQQQDTEPGEDAARSRSSSGASYGAHLTVPDASGMQPSLPQAGADDDDDVDIAAAAAAAAAAYTVLVLGQQEVGRSALLQQFMTSQFMAAETTLMGECDKTLSVLLDGVETTLSFVDLPFSVQQDSLQYADIEAYLVVFSLTDRQSYRYACDVLRLLRHHGRTDAAVILVANKSDLVRLRRVSDDEARAMCRAMNCKYIQVSAALNHRVDELLAGLVHQIRLNPQRQLTALDCTHSASPSLSSSSSSASYKQRLSSSLPSCFTALRDCLNRLVSKRSHTALDCDDLWTL